MNRVWAAFFLTALFAAAAVGDEIPREGLQLWLKADGDKVFDGPTLTQWNDMSGNGNHAVRRSLPGTVAANPALVQDGDRGKPVLRFDGSSISLAFRRIPDIRTTFWVAPSRSAGTSSGSSSAIPSGPCGMTPISTPGTTRPPASGTSR